MNLVLKLASIQVKFTVCQRYVQFDIRRMMSQLAVVTLQVLNDKSALESNDV